MKTAFLYTALSAFALTTSSLKAESWMYFDHQNSPLPSNTVLSELVTDHGIWVGTDAGLAFYDGTDWEVYNSETSALPDDNVRDIHEDVNHNIWVATDEGLLKITHLAWEVYNTSNSELPVNLVRSVSSDTEGNIWIGTWGEGVAHLEGNQWTIYNDGNSDLPSNGVFSVDVDELGHPWIGTYNGGVTEFDGQTWTTYDMSNSPIPHNNIRNVVFGHSGIKWFCTDDGLVRKTPDGNWDVHTFESIGYTFHVVNGGVQRSQGQLYFATDGGVLEFDQSEFRMITSQNSSLPANNIRSIDIDEDGNLWLGTASNGLATYLPQGSVDVKEPNKGSDLITVYPNPVVNELTFLLPNRDPGNTELIISNGLGQPVIRKQLVQGNGLQQQLDVSSLSQGYYSLSIVSNQGISSSRFLKL